MKAGSRKPKAVWQLAGAGQRKQCPQAGMQCRRGVGFPMSAFTEVFQLCRLTTGNGGANGLLPASEQLGSTSSCGQQLHEFLVQLLALGNLLGSRIQAHLSAIPHPRAWPLLPSHTARSSTACSREPDGSAGEYTQGLCWSGSIST